MIIFASATGSLGCKRPTTQQRKQMSDLSISMPHPTDQSASGRECRLLSIVVPMLNEAKGLDGLIVKLKPALDEIGVPWEVVFVDDGSTDGTFGILRQLNASDARFRAVSLSRNFREGDRHGGRSQLRAWRRGRHHGCGSPAST
jgi:cellulose synthase/poly-beta-1,6-N-acetylglucosamine synthase-like glycosyltransferase